MQTRSTSKRAVASGRQLATVARRAPRTPIPSRAIASTSISTSIQDAPTSNTTTVPLSLLEGFTSTIATLSRSFERLTEKLNEHSKDLHSSQEEIKEFGKAVKRPIRS
ncbi:hypothetical protein JAAARDRAFT_40068 [Jaapia argillacea MUCL 33604]|uniref:Uncharacterized protein n=1 Tax=Jaapia argillacea MUCL 33604 TaxID=933084 RepID=A0A067PQ65_9AGAM|nr:hypothetical protein JAAARDRAFT_40068 [Jaapia argillacea MUCL 33604]